MKASSAAAPLGFHQIFEGDRRVLKIEGVDYEVDAIFTDPIIGRIKELIAKGVKSGEKVGMLEQMISAMYSNSYRMGRVESTRSNRCAPGKPELIRRRRLRVPAFGLRHFVSGLELV